MYQRRKALLGLIKYFGGNLQRTDCQKLMFLFCQLNDEDYYDFFPYQYGAYSLTLDYDKRYLIDKGYLIDHDDFRLKNLQGIQLNLFSQNEFQRLKDHIGNLRGEDLVHRTYIDYPYYATKSNIAQKILSDDELTNVIEALPSDEKMCLFSIGYEGVSIDSYINKLLSNNIQMLIDVRANPISRKYGFSKNQFERYVTNVGIKYIHMPELGIPSHLRRNLDYQEDYEALFDYYALNMLPEQTEKLGELENLLYDNQRVALTCFEADYHCCHRSRITEYFASQPKFEVSIQHI